MKKIKFLLPVLAFIFAIGASFAFSTEESSLTTYYNYKVDDTGSCTNLGLNPPSGCDNTGTPQCIIDVGGDDRYFYTGTTTTACTNVWKITAP